jgi:acylphosphatase
MDTEIVQQLRIHGRVQGVGYRASMVQQAQRLGLSGWVRNRLDGTVEAVVAGRPQAVEAIIAWARRGPPAAMVEAVEVQPASGRYSGFEQRPTA